MLFGIEIGLGEPRGTQEVLCFVLNTVCARTCKYVLWTDLFPVVGNAAATELTP